jgi:hypothetical protein
MENAMKTLNLILVVAAMSVTTLGLGQSENRVNPFTASLPLSSAMLDQQLVKAIRSQIDPQNILYSESKVYTARISSNGSDYLIFGTVQEWLDFFNVSDNINKPPIHAAIHTNIRLPHIK